jgi:hypothetical protein
MAVEFPESWLSWRCNGHTPNMNTSHCDLMVNDALEMLDHLLRDRCSSEPKLDAACRDPQAIAVLLELLTEISSAAVEVVADQRKSTYDEAVEWVVNLAKTSRTRTLAADSRGVSPCR